ncbi:CaiB/BaiF CoA-transferase family protein [Bordetella sp. BOR01]|uniref:CaiB/BaiF CoA transferase family protein n=1 Tax=Bordetella sp. BOR01 TaxID=2854779 RepID=UPI001C48681A|nr:CaiB/BaiF CoA-transferase family protein [Bordetella sp. BOR01]MBV7482356.1 CoA transferase [Bordetella sp. BOR01]
MNNCSKAEKGGESKGPLAGIQVLDFTHVISGPYSTQILADLGASVIKVEGVEKGDVGRDMAPAKNGMSHYFATFNRNKRSIAVDLKSAQGQVVARQLVERADVIVENFAPGVIDKLGLGYEAAKTINPAVVYCSISGFGQIGPLAHKRSLDLVAQAYAGIMSTNGTADAPPLKVGVPIGDTSASLFAVIGIVSALFERRTTGLGRYLDIAMYDSLLALLGNHGGYFHFTGTQAQRAGSGHYFSVPYGTFDAADKPIVIAVMTDASWIGLCAALGVPALGHDPRYATVGARAENRDALHREICPLIRAQASQDLLEKLEAHNVPHAPVNTVGDALQHAHTEARNMVLRLEHAQYGPVSVTSLPLNGVMRSAHAAPPLRGEHTSDVLLELGHSQADIDALVRQSAVGTLVSSQ